MAFPKMVGEYEHSVATRKKAVDLVEQRCQPLRPIANKFFALCDLLIQQGGMPDGLLLKGSWVDLFEQPQRSHKELDAKLHQYGWQPSPETVNNSCSNSPDQRKDAIASDGTPHTASANEQPPLVQPNVSCEPCEPVHRPAQKLESSEPLPESAPSPMILESTSQPDTSTRKRPRTHTSKETAELCRVSLQSEQQQTETRPISPAPDLKPPRKLRKVVDVAVQHSPAASPTVCVSVETCIPAGDFRVPTSSMEPSHLELARQCFTQNVLHVSRVSRPNSHELAKMNETNRKIKLSAEAMARDDGSWSNESLSLYLEACLGFFECACLQGASEKSLPILQRVLDMAKAAYRHATRDVAQPRSWPDLTSCGLALVAEQLKASTEARILQVCEAVADSLTADDATGSSSEGTSEAVLLQYWTTMAEQQDGRQHLIEGLAAFRCWAPLEPEAVAQHALALHQLLSAAAFDGFNQSWHGALCLLRQGMVAVAGMMCAASEAGPVHTSLANGGVL